MAKKRKQTAKKPTIRWYRPKAKNTDITVITQLGGYEVSIPPLKGGGNLKIYKLKSGGITICREGRFMDFSLGEMEALAVVYTMLQGPK